VDLVKRILLIDDDHSTRAMLKKHLERAGYDVIEMTEGRLGLEYYRRHPTDVVITNVLPSDLSGLRTIILFKKEFPAVPILATCAGQAPGFSQYDPLQSAKIFGAAHAFSMPVEIKTLLSAIKDLKSLVPKFWRRRLRHTGFQISHKSHKKDEFHSAWR